ncbi:MAG: protein kinase family protein [Micromonosporaceae bacterium]
MTQVGAPAVGEILADRYRIEEHVNDDSTGRQVWRGVDVILQRAVTIVLRTPGGAEADEMLNAAVAASRVAHPNIVGVYDAIDEGSRAYVVREWVEGKALRDVVRESPLEPSHAIAVARAVADALSAVHATGVSHGNVHPGTVLLSDDGRVVLGDARANDHTTIEADVRAVGAILYCALTGHWPRSFGPNGTKLVEAGPVTGDAAPRPAPLPDAPTVTNGRQTIASPRQLRGGLPAPLDELTMDLLNPDIPAPGAAELAVELSRMTYHDQAHQYRAAGYSQPAYTEPAYTGNEYQPVSAGPLGFSNAPQRDRGELRPMWRKLGFGVASLLVIALAGLLVGTGLFGGLFANGGTGPGSQTTTGAGNDGTGTGRDTGEPTAITIKPDMVRLVDSKGGDRTEGDGIELAIDGDPATGWATDEYQGAKFGNLKKGMGLLIDLGEPTQLSSVNLKLSAPEATVSVLTGDEDFGDSFDGDERIVKEYTSAIGPKRVETTAQLAVDVQAQYVLIWITELPTYEGKFQVEIKEIQVLTGAK